MRLSASQALSDDGYRLIDFGDGRKLESLAGYVVDRPSPAAAWAKPAIPDRWNSADARYDLETKKWKFVTPWPESLLLDCGAFRMPCLAKPFGHVGVFPEQFDNWQWLGNPVSTMADSTSGLPSALNLFGYTGASTMALVSAGFQVAHVDAAKPNVQAVSVAGVANGWATPPIRYLIDDAPKFAAREVRRGRRYHTIVMDPPAYGHGPSGRGWQLDRDLWSLLQDCVKLVDPASFRLLLTGHSPSVDQSDVVAFFEQNAAIDTSGLRIASGRSQLTDESGRHLDAGFFVRLETTTDEKCETETDRGSDDSNAG